MISFKRFVGASTSDVDAAAQQAQHDAPVHDLKRGEYLKGSVLFQGIPLAIENPIGSVRRGEGWETHFTSHYGYIEDAIGNDGDGIDVFVGHNHESDYVLAVNQRLEGKFDEHKIMLGFNNREEAMEAYVNHHDSSWPKQSAMDTTVEELKHWLGTQDKTKPYSPWAARNIALDKRRGGDLVAVTQTFFKDVFARINK